MPAHIVDDDIALLDLDDANLYTRGQRPTQVIERNRAATQAWALSVCNERNDRRRCRLPAYAESAGHQPHRSVLLRATHPSDPCPNFRPITTARLPPSLKPLLPHGQPPVF